MSKALLAEPDGMNLPLAPTSMPNGALAPGFSGLRVRAHLLAMHRWVTASLARRFVCMSLALLLVIQLISFGVVDLSLRRHARQALPQQLNMGARSVHSLMQWRAGTLLESARLLAADYGFRSAVLSRDRATIASVLDNHGARIDATEVALLGPDFQLLAHTDDGAWDASTHNGMVAALAARAAQEGSASVVTVLAGQARQVVMVPVRAPVLMGWVLMCFALPEPMADEVHRLSGTDLTLLSRTGPHEAWTLGRSRLPPAVAERLAQQHWDPAAHADSEMIERTVDGRLYGLRALWLLPPQAAAPTPESPAHQARSSGEPLDHGPRDTARESPQPLQNPEMLALLSVSVDEALRPPRDLQWALLLSTLFAIAAFALVSAYMARHITTPLMALAHAAEGLGRGDYTHPVAVRSHDEVGELARSFERMRSSMASTQEQIVQSEKLASIGQLAAGVAHEINNPIGFVFSNFGTLEQYLQRLFRMLTAYQQAELALPAPAQAPLRRLREEIELDYLQEDIPALMSESRDGITRVRKIVQDLKDFSHVDAHQQWEFVDLHRGLDSTLNIVNNELKYKAELVKDYGTLPEVECLPGELNQVFMNLLVNAAHAIGPQRGTITLRTGVAADAEASEVWVEVADNGCGIDPADLKRIFDPFFTTKPVGQGTGLGLSLSYGIVKKHNGRIDVHSEIGLGTRMRVCLPVRHGMARPE